MYSEYRLRALSTRVAPMFWSRFQTGVSRRVVRLCVVVSILTPFALGQAPAPAQPGVQDGATPSVVTDQRSSDSVAPTDESSAQQQTPEPEPATDSEADKSSAQP